MTEESSANDKITLRVSGLGHNLTFDVPGTATVGDVKAHVENLSSLPAAYQRLISRGKKLDEDGATLASKEIKNRTKLMLMHSEVYVRDKEGVAAIKALEKEIDELALKQDLAPNAIHELVTQICCKLDAVDVAESAHLRNMRKKALRRAEALDTPKNE